MEVENIKMKSIKLSEKEKDQLCAAFDIVNRVLLTMNGILIVDNEVAYKLKEVATVETFLENLVEADRIIAD